MRWFALTWSLYGVVFVVARKICRTEMDFVTAGKAYKMHWFVICVALCNYGTE